jgi:Trypsin.
MTSQTPVVLQTGGPSSDTLQMVNLTTYSDEECQEVLPGYVTASNICAGVPEGGKGQCGVSRGGIRRAYFRVTGLPLVLALLFHSVL